MVTDAQEQAAIKKMPSWQREIIRENDERDRKKSQIPVRKVPKGYIEEHSKRLLQHTSAFVDAGDYLREVMNGGFGVGRKTKDMLIEEGTWPLQSKGNIDRITRLGMVTGDYDTSLSTVVQVNKYEDKARKKDGKKHKVERKEKVVDHMQAISIVSNHFRKVHPEVEVKSMGLSEDSNTLICGLCKEVLYTNVED